MTCTVLDEFLFEHFKSSYSTEDARTDRLRDRASFAVNLQVILWGVLIYLIASFPEYKLNGLSQWMFYVPTFTAIIIAIWSAWNIFKALGSDYKYLSMPTSVELLDYSSKMVQEDGLTGKEDEAVGVIKRHMILAYAQNSDFNASVNRQRANYLLAATRSVVRGICVISLVIPGYLMEKSKEKPAIIRVQMEK